MMLLLICSWVVGGIFLLAALYGFAQVRNLIAERDDLEDVYLDAVSHLTRKERAYHRLAEENSRFRRDLSDAHICLELVINDKPKQSAYDPHQTTLILLP